MIVRTFIKFMLSSILLAVVIVCVTVGGLPYIVPSSVVKQMAAEIIQQNIGGTLTIDGTASIRLVPQFQLIFDSASYIDPQLPDKPIQLGRSNLRLDTWSLLHGKIDLFVDTIVEKHPIHGSLRVDDWRVLLNEENGKTPFRFNIASDYPIDIYGTIIAEENRLTLSDFSLQLKESNLRGSLAYGTANGNTGNISGKLEAKAIYTEEMREYISLLLGLTEARDHLAPPTDTHETEKGWPPSLNLKQDSLHQYSGNVVLSADKIVDPRYIISNTALKATLENSVLNVDILEGIIEEGNITGSLNYNSSVSPPTIHKKITITNIALGDFFRRAYDFNRLAGKGNLSVDVKGTGDNAKTLLSTLNGTISLQLERGAFKGLDATLFNHIRPENIPAVLKQFREDNPKKQTEIISMSANATVENGIIYNDDLAIHIPFTQLTGKGEFDLNTLMIDYTIIPKTGLQAAGLMLPLNIRGPITHPKLGLDIADGIGKTLKKYTGSESLTKPIDNFRKTFPPQPLTNPSAATDETQRIDTPALGPQ